MREINLCRAQVSKQEKMRLYNENYRKTHSKTICCPCGSSFKEISKYSHAKSNRHIEYKNGSTLGDGRTDDLRSCNSIDNLQGSETSTG